MSGSESRQPAAKDTRRKVEGAMPDLDGMSVQQLTALIEAAEVKRREKQAEAKAEMLARWQEEAAEAGLSLDAVLRTSAPPSEPRQGRKPRKDQGMPLPAKYRGPNGEEWTGRGRMPKWLQTLAAEGKSREDFRV